MSFGLEDRKPEPPEPPSPTAGAFLLDTYVGLSSILNHKRNIFFWTNPATTVGRQRGRYWGKTGCGSLLRARQVMTQSGRPALCGYLRRCLAVPGLRSVPVHTRGTGQFPGLLAGHISFAGGIRLNFCCARCNR